MRKYLYALVGAALLLGQSNTLFAQEGFADQTSGLNLKLGPIDFSMHGYFRAPLRLAWRDRGMVTGGKYGYNIHTPWLIDDDYFQSGFAYTRLQEADWSELYFSVGNKSLTATVALMGSLYSDWARPIIDRQWGIAQAFLTYNWQAEGPRLKFKMHVRGGAFWDRFGYLENYDTYVFGRTHQLGGQVRFEFAGERYSAWLVHGVGAHLENIETNQGLTLLNYLHAGVGYRKLARVGFYFLDASAHDQRQLKDIKDADERVFGVDVAVEHASIGKLYLAASRVSADQASYLSPAIEVVHAFGGQGLAQNYLGTDKSDNGTGGLWNIAFQEHWSVRWLMDKYAPSKVPALHNCDVTLRLFGLYTYVNSKQDDLNPVINRNERAMFKWGAEAAWQGLGWLQVSLRYDRVILDLQDNANSFRSITPRITITTPHWYLGAKIYLQYSRYFYGERIGLRSGQVALETIPDKDVFKLQAEVSF